MKLLNKPFRMMSTVVVLVMALCLFAAQAVAQIDPEALDKVEQAAAAGNSVGLNAAAYDAAKYAVDNEMSIQEACHQISFVTVMAASGSGQNIESAVRSAVDGVNAAANELAQTASANVEVQVLELDTYACAVYGIKTAAQSLDLEEDTVAALIDSMSPLLPEPVMPEAPVLETPDIRDQGEGSPI